MNCPAQRRGIFFGQKESSAEAGRSSGETLDEERSPTLRILGRKMKAKSADGFTTEVLNRRAAVV
jgi:hypothetical protein